MSNATLRLLFEFLEPFLEAFEQDKTRPVSLVTPELISRPTTLNSPCETCHNMIEQLADLDTGTQLHPVTITSDMLVQLLAQISAGAPASSPHAHSMKIPDVESFSGDGTQIRTWISQYKSKFSKYLEATNAQKIIYASNKTKRPAGKWILPAFKGNTYKT